jgi:hypothetical protein
MSRTTWHVSSQHTELGYFPHIRMLKKLTCALFQSISKNIFVCVFSFLLHYHFVLQAGFDLMTLTMMAHTTAMFLTNQKKKKEYLLKFLQYFLQNVP